jgi:outer membrane protein TolC
MEVQTPDLKAQPLNFQGERSQHQLILNTELPLVRKLERNNYRASLISYQQSRRALMAAEDQILLQVRQELRDLRQLSEIYKLQQRALILAYLQVNQAREVLVADPDPGLQRDAATAAAALTQQLLNALRSVPQAENSLLSTWVSYQTSRIQLYRDLELLQVDGRGVWIDDLAADQQRVDSAASQPAADTQPRTEERPGKPG